MVVRVSGRRRVSFQSSRYKICFVGSGRVVVVVPSVLFGGAALHVASTPLVLTTSHSTYAACRECEQSPDLNAGSCNRSVTEGCTEACPHDAAPTSHSAPRTSSTQEACLIGMPRFSQNQPAILTKGPQLSAGASRSSQDPGILICLTAAMNTSTLCSRK